MTPEQKLEALFAAQAPAARDFAFELAVMERVGRRRALARFTRLGLMTLAGSSLLLAAGWAVDAGELGAMIPLLAGAAGSALAGLVVWTVRPTGGRVG
jgi:hypothetical protein